MKIKFLLGLLMMACAVMVQAQTCTLTGQVRMPNLQTGTAPAVGVSVTVVKVIKSGMLLQNIPTVAKTDGNGDFSLVLPADSTAYINAPVIGLNVAGGAPVAVPPATSCPAVVSTLPASRLTGLSPVTVVQGGGGGSGTVTSFTAGSLAPLFTTSVANSTTTPTLTFSLTAQSANTVFAGPTTGAAAAPTFRALVLADIPDLSSLYSPVSHTHAFSALTGKPTTLAGYGITDAAAASHTHAAADIVSGTLPVARGGTGQSTYTDGQLLIGNSTGNTLAKSTLTAGSGISITNGAGSITIAATGGGGGDFSSNTSTSVDGEVVLFSGTAGKTGKRATGTGLAKLTSGVLGTGTAGTDYVAPGAATGSGLTMATARILGRTTASAGAIEEITVGSGLALSGGTLTATAGGGGTVTNTGGNLTNNAIVLGAGSADAKVVAGIFTDGVSELNLGVAGSSMGRVVLTNTTSGSLTVQPVSGALGTQTISFPAASGTVTVLGNNSTGSGNIVMATSPAMTTPAITGGTLTGITILGLRSSGTGAFDVRFVNTDNLTGQRNLTLNLNDADRSVSLAGNVILAGAFSTSGANSLTLTTTGTTSITLPVTGTVATLAGSEGFSNKTLANTVSFSGFTDVTRISVPTNPSSGNLRVYANNSTGKLGCVDSAGADCMPSGGGGGGDFSSNTSTSVDGEVVLFSGTAGKTGKRATGTGLAKLTSGVLGTGVAGTDYVAPGAATGSGLTMATARILGRTTASAGAIEEITVGSGLSLSGGTLTATGGGGGTVTNTGGNLTANAVVLGAGSADTKVVTGISTDGASQINLGVNATTLGKLKLFGNTSGDVTVQPQAAAGTAVVVTLPNASSTLPIFGQQVTFSGPTAARTITLPDENFTAVGTNTTQVMANKTLTSPVINVGSDGTGDIYYRNAGGAFTRLAYPGGGFVLYTSSGLPTWSTSLSSLTLTGGTHTGLTGLGIRSTGTGAFDLTLANAENLTAGRTLTIAVNDAARTLTVAGNATISGTNTGDQTVTLTGDVTGSGTGSFAATIANDAVTFAKIQNITDNRLLGRSAGSTGDAQEITIGSGLSLSGGTLSATGGASLPTIDTTSIVEGSADGTKELRFEVDGFTTSTVRTLTPQNASYTIAGTDLAQTFSAVQTISFSSTTYNGLIVENTSNDAAAYAMVRMENDGSDLSGLFRNSSANATYAGANALMLYQGASAPIGFVTNNLLRGQFTGGGLFVLGSGATSAYPALKRNNAGIDVRLADDSGYAALNMGTAAVVSAQASAFQAGDATNPQLKINAATGSVATGLHVTGAAAGGGLALAVISSGTNEALTINGKGTGSVTINGVAVSSAGVITGATIDTAGTGIVFSMPVTVAIAAAGCNGATAGNILDLPTSGAPTAGCLGTTTTSGYLEYNDAATSTAIAKIPLPSDWTSTGGVDVRLLYTGDTSSANNIRWQVSCGCVNDAEDITAPSYNTATASSSAGPSTAAQRKSVTVTGLTITNCAASETMYIKVERLGSDGADAYTGKGRLLDVEVTYRVSK